MTLAPIAARRRDFTGGGLTALNLLGRVAIRDGPRPAHDGGSTVATASARPLFLEVAPDPVFGMFHAPRRGCERRPGPRSSSCPPWGWDEVASYTSRRAWADDSPRTATRPSGSTCPGPVTAPGRRRTRSRRRPGRDAITAAAAWLAASPGVSRVAAIGLGLGGLLAAAAIAGGAPDRRPGPVGGARSGAGPSCASSARSPALQDTRLGAGRRAGRRTGCPDGWLEVGGFVLSAETIAALEALELAAMSSAGLSARAAARPRRHRRRCAPSRHALGSAGVEVTTAPGPGWTGMVFHPEQYAPAAAASSTRSTAWLDERAVGVRRPDRRVAAPPIVETTSSCSRTASESGRRRSGSSSRSGELFGVLGRAGRRDRRRTCRGRLPERRRRPADRPEPAVGRDVAALERAGRADDPGGPRGDRRRRRRSGPLRGRRQLLHARGRARRCGSIVDDLERRGFGPRFVLIGLCAGGYWAFHTARRRTRGWSRPSS